MVDLSVTLAAGHKQELHLRNPVMTASGTFSNGIEFAARFDVDALGALVSKGTTLRPRRGNPQPRTVETPAGMINSIGFQNVGVGALIRQVAPVWARWDVPVLVNIMGDSVDEYGTLAARLDSVTAVAGLEVNVSCPNVAVGGIEFGQDPVAAADVVRVVRDHTSLPFAVKLTPSVADIRPIVEAVTDAGSDAITVSNTVPAMAIDVANRRPALATTFGWPLRTRDQADRAARRLPGGLGHRSAGDRLRRDRLRPRRRRVHHGWCQRGTGGNRHVPRSARAVAGVG